MIPMRGDRPPSLQVSSLLHTLRGEEFRRRRNLLGVRAQAPASSSHGPSLPPLFTSNLDPEGQELDPIPSPPVLTSKVAGPRPPRSWIPSAPSSTPHATPEWRARALSLLIKHSPSHSPALANLGMPSLFQLCLRELLLEWGGIPPEVFPDLPRHILREYVRYSAVHDPNLPREDLEALWSVDNAGSADGELIVSRVSAGSIIPRLSSSTTSTVTEWDSPPDTDPEPPPPLHTLAILSSPLSPSLTSSFPPTLTHLALLAVPPLALHKLPAQLPLITFLDLSFNAWVGDGVARVARVEWRRWVGLEVLGLRECGLREGDVGLLEGKVNRGRLRDVEIVVSG